MDCGNTYSISQIDRGILFKKNNVMSAYILSNGTINTGAGTITTTGISASSLTLFNPYEESPIVLSSEGGMNTIHLGGSAGTSGQFLASGGSTGSVYWSSEGSQNLASVLSKSPMGASSGQGITLSQNSGITKQMVLNNTNGDIRMNTLHSGMSINLQTTLGNSNLLLENITANAASSFYPNQISLHDYSDSKEFKLTSSSITINGYSGTNGQVLGKNNGSLAWITVSQGMTSVVSESTATLATVLSAGSTASVNQRIHLSANGTTYPGGVSIQFNDAGKIGIFGQLNSTPFVNYDSVQLGGNGLTVSNINTSTTSGEFTSTGVSISNSSQQMRLTLQGVSSVNTPLNLYGTTIGVGTTLTSNIHIGSQNSQTQLNGQVEFSIPPHSIDPVLGNDLATKGYVDTLIGNYSGNGLSLYFNVSSLTNPITSYPLEGVLGQTLTSVAASSTYYTLTTPSLGTTLLASFTTDVGFPNTTTIPVGLWSMMIYGYTTSSVGQLFYSFKLVEVKPNSTTVIATSGYSGDVNTTNSSDPNAFNVSIPILSPYTLEVSSRLRVEIYSTGTGMSSESTLMTLFGGLYYSFITTTLSGTSSLLTSNNTWSGSNSFSLLPTAPTATAGSSNTYLATTAFVDTSFLKISAASALYATIESLSGYLSAGNLATALLSYAQTTISNTWNMIQTFAGGIYTGSILADPTSPVNLYTTQTSGMITVGSSTSTVRMNGLNYNQNTINPIETSGNLYVGNLQTNGELYLGNGATRTGAIYLGKDGCTINVGGTLKLQYGITSTSTLNLGSATGINTNNSPINTGTGNITMGGTLYLGTNGITSSGALSLGAATGIITNGASLNLGTGTLTTTGTINLGANGITSSGALSLGSATGINTNNSTINTGTGNLTVGGTITATTYGITSTGTLKLGSATGIITNNSPINTGTGNITMGGTLYLGANGITSTGTLNLGAVTGISTNGASLNLGTGALTTTGAINLGANGITSTGTLNLGSATGINTNNSPINTGTGTITTSTTLNVGGSTLGILLSTVNFNQLKIDTNPGTAGQVLTSGGPSGALTWSTVSGGGGGGAVFPDIHLVFTTSGNVTSTLNLSVPDGYVWLTPTAGGATGRTYLLPTTGVTVGYTVTIRNNSGASWTATNNMTNGSIFGAGTGNTLTIGNNTTAVIKYMGLISVSGLIRNIWVS